MLQSFVMSLGICSYFLVNNTKYELEILTFPLGKEMNLIWFLVLRCHVDGAMQWWACTTKWEDAGFEVKSYEKVLFLKY